MDSNLDMAQRAEQYAQARGIMLMQCAGAGVNGTVWFTNRDSVIKAFARLEYYERERDVYFRLALSDTFVINEFSVPRLLAFDEKRWILEMGTVTPPFVLDFAGAYLDKPPEFPPEALAEQEERNKMLFGPRWPRVRLLLARMQAMGIFYVDINRGNIRFPEFDDEQDSLD